MTTPFMRRMMRSIERMSSPTMKRPNSAIALVSPGPMKASPYPVIPSSVSTFTIVQSKFASTTAVLTFVIFMRSHNVTQEME
jgi:hypothetical protein